MHQRIDERMGRGTLAMLSLLAACGARPTAVGVEGEPGAPPAEPPAESSTTTTTTSSGSGFTRPSPAPEGGCVVALRLDVCCPIPEPLDESAVAADPCLVPYPYDFNAGVTPPVCEARRPLPCDDGCGPLNKRPASVFAARDGQTGQCAFADECATDADCQLAVDLRFCCLCDDAWPVRYVEAEACVYPTDRSADWAGPDACRPAACDDSGCLGCPSAGLRIRPWEAFCLTPRGGSPRQCAMR